MSARLLSGNKTMKKIILFFFIFILLVNNASAYTFTNIGKDFKIEYPAGWNYNEEPDGTDQTFTSQTGRAWVRVVVLPSEGMSLDEIVGDRIRYLNSLGSYPFSEKYVTISGVTGKELMFYEEYQQKEYKERQVLILSGDKYFIITAGSLTSDFPFFSEDLNKIINSFTLIKPAITPKVTVYTPVPTPTQTPEEIEKELSASIKLHMDRTSVSIGEEVKLTLSLVSVITKPVMRFQIILIPPSGMSVTAKEFSQTAAGQYSFEGTVEPGKERPVMVNLKANEPGVKDVEGWVIYYFGDDFSTKVEKRLKEKITVAAPEVTATVKRDEGPSGDGSAIVGIIAIIAIIFTAYVFINKIIKSVKGKVSKGEEPPTGEVQAQKTIEHPGRIEEEREIREEFVEEPKHEVKVAKRKESAFEIERRKQHLALPPESLDLDTRNYLSFGANTAVSTLDAEIARAGSDAMQIQGEVRKTEDILGKLGTRLVNKEISDQTYNDLKNKYTRKVSELKNKVANLESGAAKLKKIRSFVQEKGKYYT